MAFANKRDMMRFSFLGFWATIVGYHSKVRHLLLIPRSRSITMDRGRFSGCGWVSLHAHLHLLGCAIAFGSGLVRQRRKAMRGEMQRAAADCKHVCARGTFTFWSTRRSPVRRATTGPIRLVHPKLESDEYYRGPAEVRRLVDYELGV